MDQVKIGKFIAQRRKSKNLTQASLAEKLNITDRAISKWETGKGMPDTSIMLELCSELEISVNELLSGEMIEMKDYDKKAEELLLEMAKNEETNNKKLLMLETVIGLISAIPFIILAFVVEYTKMEFVPAIILMITSGIVFIIGISFAMKIEREVGYYECNKCHHKYIPKSLPFWFSMHYGRTRHLKCPKCNEKSWNKKVLSK